jgi:hypothetical protein
MFACVLFTVNENACIIVKYLLLMQMVAMLPPGAKLVLVRVTLSPTNMPVKISLFKKIFMYFLY